MYFKMMTKRSYGKERYENKLDGKNTPKFNISYVCVKKFCVIFISFFLL